MSDTPRIGIRPSGQRSDPARAAGVYARVGKSIIDVFVGLVLSVLTFPLIALLAVFAAVATRSSGIERSMRVGRAEVPFALYRIRTGRAGRDEAGSGRFPRALSRWSLDELPQLWNVATGRMSLVGPRPMTLEEAASLDAWQARRHDVKPGLTGLWQIAARGDGRALRDNVHYDIQYIDQISLPTDLRILGTTFSVWATHREGGGRRRRRVFRAEHSRLIAVDLLLWPIAVVAAAYVRFDFGSPAVDWGAIVATGIAAAAGQLLWGYAVGLYRGRWRLGSFEEAAWVGTGVVLVTLALIGIDALAGLIPRGAIAAAGAFHLLMTTAARHVAFTLYGHDRRATQQREQRLIVFGAGRAGIDTVEGLREDPHATVEPVAFLDDDPARWGRHVAGLPIMGGTDAIASAAERYAASSLLVAMPSAAADRIEEVLDLARAAGLAVEVLPPIAQSLSSLLVAHATSSRPTRVEFADRKPSLRDPSTDAGEYDLVVLGLGYVGLPAAIEASRVGLRVGGLDIDTGKVESLTAGTSYIEDIADDDVHVALAGGFTPTTDPSILARAGVITISVPTPLRDGLPDLSAVISAAEAIGDHLIQGQTVVLESTTYPGTTEEVVLPILEKRSGLTAGFDFYLAYSPERIDPGNAQWGVHNTPKLVGGIDAESAERAAQVYRKFAPVVLMTGTREAEMAKLLENTYRHVNIALVNEMAIFSDMLGVDIWETIRGAATKPFGFQAFYPGPGVGGHCIPIDPNYLSYRIRQLGSQFQMIELAQEINEYMPTYVAQRAIGMLTEAGISPADGRVLILGVAYKPDVGDVRETSATPLVRALRTAGIATAYSDPHVPEFVVDGAPVPRLADPVEAAPNHDLVLVHTPHGAFDVSAVCAAASLVLDTRGVTTGDEAEQL